MAGLGALIDAKTSLPLCVAQMAQWVWWLVVVRVASVVLALTKGSHSTSLRPTRSGRSRLWRPYRSLCAFAFPLVRVELGEIEGAIFLSGPLCGRSQGVGGIGCGAAQANVVAVDALDGVGAGLSRAWLALPSIECPSQTSRARRSAEELSDDELVAIIEQGDGMPPTAAGNGKLNIRNGRRDNGRSPVAL